MPPIINAEKCNACKQEALSLRIPLPLMMLYVEAKK
jgi:hypothetical protein